MKITDVRLSILENVNSKSRMPSLVQVPNLHRTQYTHEWAAQDKPVQQHFIEVRTDEGVTGRCTTTMTPSQVDLLRPQVIGANPLHREYLYQKLHKGTRWVYQ